VAYSAPIAINIITPLSIGIHGGGQQPGVPAGGGGGAAKAEVFTKSKNPTSNIEITRFIFKNINVYKKLNATTIKSLKKLYLC
jgi:hypothetical protein